MTASFHKLPETAEASVAEGTIIRVVIVDEHPIVRRGLVHLLSDQPGYEVCGEAGDVPTAMKLVHDLRPHLVLLELTLRNGSGLELIKEVSSLDDSIKICVFSHHNETLFAERALRAGAHGYINKNATLEELLAALRRVQEDRVYLSARMTDRMLSRAVGTFGEPPERSPIETLSDRELEVFEHVGQGITTRQIAEQLFLSPKTVETYRENIKIKLNLRNATELTQQAVKWVLENSGALNQVGS